MKLKKITLILLLSLLMTGCQMKDYKKANELLEKEEFEESYELFVDLGDYKDSEEKADFAKASLEESLKMIAKEESYINANELLEKEEFKESYELLIKLEDYKDSEEKANLIKPIVDYLNIKEAYNEIIDNEGIDVIIKNIENIEADLPNIPGNYNGELRDDMLKFKNNLEKEGLHQIGSRFTKEMEKLLIENEDGQIERSIRKIYVNDKDNILYNSAMYNYYTAFSKYYKIDEKKYKENSIKIIENNLFQIDYSYDLNYSGFLEKEIDNLNNEIFDIEKIRDRFVVDIYSSAEEYRDDKLAKYISSQRRLEENLSENPKENPKVGMTKEEVEKSKWGKPKEINKTTTANTISEQWVYEDYKYIYFKDGIVNVIQE